MHTLSFNLRVFSSHFSLEESLRNYNSLICASPLFQGIISNWTVDTKAISWTDVGYSSIISTLIKEVAVAVNPHHVVKGAFHTSETDNC